MDRGPFKPGDVKVRDDESGIVYWRRDMVTLWDGRVVHRKNWEPDHPQKYVKAWKNDPTVSDIIRPDDSFEYLGSVVPDVYIGSSGAVDLFTETTTTANLQYAVFGPASHLFPAELGQMVVGEGHDFIRFKVY